MSTPLAIHAGLSLWSWRKPLLYAGALSLAMPLLLVALVAAVFAPLPGPGHPLLDPLPGAPVTQAFGCTSYDREPWSDTCATHHVHTGVDLGAPPGTPVFAASSGIATVDDMPAGYGLFIAVRRDDRLSTFYGHLSLVLVATGDPITPGEMIGEVGSTGNSSGSHLHFEVRLAGQPVDPLPMLPVHPWAGGGARHPLTS
jgi:murein DD-endopeptidase MepM/ murein hydrolase activator NlpD